MAQSFDNIERYLESFGKYVVKQARTNLTKARKNGIQRSSIYTTLLSLN